MNILKIFQEDTIPDKQQTMNRRFSGSRVFLEQLKMYESCESLLVWDTTSLYRMSRSR